MISKDTSDKSDPINWRHNPTIFRHLVQQGFEDSVKKAIALHHFEGRSVPIMQDGKIVYLKSDGSTTATDPDKLNDTK